MKKILTVVTGIMLSATVAAQTDTIKEKIDNVRLELQQEQVNGAPEIDKSTIEVTTKLNNGIETRNTSGNEVQKPTKRFGNKDTRQPTTDEINARAAAKLNAPQINTAANNSNQTVVAAKTTSKRSQATITAQTKAANAKRSKTKTTSTKP